MLSIYDPCMKEGIFPKQWKETRLIALLKGIEKDMSIPGLYSSISLLNGLGKVFEQMMFERIMQRMEGK